MKRLLQPSLVRRVVLALFAAFMLVWLVLLGVDYVTFKRQTSTREPIRAAARALAEALEFDDAARAAVVMRATETQYNRLRRNAAPTDLGDLLFRLARHDGSEVYASAALAASPSTEVADDTQIANVGGRRYWAVTHDSAHWRLTLLEPAVADTTALQWLGRGLLQPMLIAFPFVLLPLWIAVRRGLAPLRRLAERVALRSPTDFSPLGVELQHAELKPLVAAIEALLARSREGIARERAFVQDAAHELRTPLAVIAAQAHALSAAEAHEDRLRAKAALEQAIARASHLTHQLLTLARLEGDTETGMAAVNLVELAQRVLVDAEPAAAARGIELALDSPDRLDATLDESALHSILENLVGNAIKYGRDGGRVVVGIAAKDDALTLTVADDGPGIADARRMRLFERFRRGNHNGIGGAGLGLAIVRQATGRLGGRIECGEGLDGRGIGFAITLPAPASRSHRPAA